MKIITGRTGEHHVYASDDAELYRLFLGDGDWVLPTGNKLSASMEGVTTIHVSDGSIIMQGRLAKIRVTDGFDTLTFDNGIVGYKRVDLVVAEYTQTVTEKEIQVEDPETHEIITVTQEDRLESVELKVVKGENNKDVYIEPDIITGNIDAGETHQMKLYAVRFDGVNFDSLVSYIEGQLLTDTPFNTLIATTLAAKAQADDMVHDMLEQVAEIAEKISTGAVLYCEDALLKDVKVSGEDKYSVPVIGYVHEAGDTIEVFINGLKLTSDEYTVTFGTDAIIVEYVIAYGDTDAIEVVIRR